MKKFAYILLLAASFVLTDCTSDVLKGVRSVDMDEFGQVISDSKVQILDVRTSTEFMKGHITNAINIDIRSAEFSDKVHEKLEKERPVAIYCQTGRRSKIAAGILLDMGYEVIELNDGVAGWQGAVSYGQN